MDAEEQAGTGSVIREFRVAEDAPEVTSLLAATPEATLWSESDLLRMRELTGVTALVAEEPGGISGIVIGRRVGNEAEVLNLAVRQEKRRKGEGKRLVGKLLDEYRRLRVSRVFLEVRESNAGAVVFYEGLGFRAVGVRKDYYQDPREPALVMELRLWKSTEATP
jgi:ribosomal-protein-alanine N-acetyltransferase